MIISFILMNLKFDLGVIIYEEIRRWLQIIFKWDIHNESSPLRLILRIIRPNWRVNFVCFVLACFPIYLYLFIHVLHVSMSVRLFYLIFAWCFQFMIYPRFMLRNRLWFLKITNFKQIVFSFNVKPMDVVCLNTSFIRLSVRFLQHGKIRKFPTLEQQKR